MRWRRTRERFANEIGTVLLAAAVAGAIAARPLRRMRARRAEARTGRSHMADRPDDRSEDRNEGEGSRTAADRYRRGVEEHLRRGKVQEEAERAARDLDEDREALRRAEDEGKSRSAGDLPGDLER
jgi:hypothetical protein